MELLGTYIAVSAGCALLITVSLCFLFIAGGISMLREGRKNKCSCGSK